MTDDDKTPPRTPSAQHALGLAACPQCDGKGTVEDGGALLECSYCEGCGRVTLARHHEYIGLAVDKSRKP